MITRVFTVGTTSRKRQKYPIAISSVRHFSLYEVISILINSDVCFDELLDKLRAHSNYIFVDTEKKQPLSFVSHDYNGNLFKRIYESAQRHAGDSELQLFPIKLNDLTVDAVIDSVYADYGDISGLNVALIGTGNIGFKCTLALTECGANLSCFNRTSSKSETAVSCVSTFKPFHTIASPRTARQVSHAFNLADFSIIASSHVDLPIHEIVKCVKPNHIMYVLGHSIFSSSDLTELSKANIIVKRIDIGRPLLSYVIGQINTSSYAKYGSSILNNLKLCSGGYIADQGALVVDDHQSPQIILGMCDGIGGMSPVTHEYLEAHRIKSIQSLSDLEKEIGI